MNSKKKAIFLDMDGTTLDDDKKISKENLDALKRMMEAGDEVVITTGRATPSAKYLLKTHGLDKINCRYILSFNGGEMYDCKKEEVVFSKQLSSKVIYGLNQKAKELGIYIQAYDESKILTEKDDECLANYVEKSQMQYEIVKDLSEAAMGKTCKMLAIDLNNIEALEQFAKEIEHLFGDEVDAYFSSREYLEIVPKGVCKGNALVIFCEKFGISMENTIAVGDESNDISMIRRAGVGCAVANAIEEVKLAADYITERDNNHSAVCEVIEKFVLS